MIEFIGSHRIRPVVSKEFAFTQAAEAFALMERGEQFGKIVIDI